MAFKCRLSLLLCRRICGDSIFDASPEHRKLLKAAIKNLMAQQPSIPIDIGNEQIYTGDSQNLVMPHNHRLTAAKFFFATKNHLQFAVANAGKIGEEWSNTDINYRAKVYQKAADILSTPEKQTELVAALMLSQAKTRYETNRDTCRLIHMLRSTAETLLKIPETFIKSDNKNLLSTPMLRPLDGFVAATGPRNMTWVSAHMALVPLIMGNAVLWRPPNVCVHSTYIVFSAMIEAGVPKGALQFVPSNYKLFLDTVIHSPTLAGINFGGRVETLRNIWHDLAIRLTSYKCFPRLVGECNNKGFHFVHESANLDLVVNFTIRAAFRYSGQRGNCCGRIYLPASKWPEICCEFNSAASALKIGDPTDDECFASAIIHPALFDGIVEYIQYAATNEECEIICGGNYNKSLGYFIEPTIVECQNPENRMLVDDIPGPVLSVFVYQNEKLDEILATVKNVQKFGGCGAIFGEDEQVMPYLIKNLRSTASNLFINNQCCGSHLSQMPLSGNRLSGTNDRPDTMHYLMRFAAPQVMETMMLPPHEAINM